MTTTQTEFRAALLDPGIPAPEGVRNPDGAQATKRFDVYRNNVAVSLTEALETAFPVVRKLVGEDFFHAMAGVFLRAHPPSSPVMMFYGAEMPAFVRDFGPAQSLPYLGDVAALELAFRHSYHAADATAVAPDALGQLAPDTLPHVVFTFAPAVQLVPSRFPLHSIWWANTHGGQNTQDPEPAIVTRPEFDPMVDALNPEQTAVCAALMVLGLLLSRNAITSLKT